jgi:folate-dependent phosphoribosylglycinamide formyltransferase PurN
MVDGRGRQRSVVVLGKGTLAIRVASWFSESSDHDLRAVVPVIPEPTWTDSFEQWARQAGVMVVESGHYRDLDVGTIDLAVSVFYDKILSAAFIDSCGRGLNIHNGPLPRYRGVSPINWALKNGERMHGVTIHEITPGIDDGPIVAQVLYSIYPELDEVVDVYNRALEYGWTLFQQTMPNLDRIEATAQDEKAATYYSLAENDLLGDRRGFTRKASRASLSSATR